jgi:hypothetical protein
MTPVLVETAQRADQRTLLAFLGKTDQVRLLGGVAGLAAGQVLYCEATLHRFKSILLLKMDVCLVQSLPLNRKNK